MLEFLKKYKNLIPISLALLLGLTLWLFWQLTNRGTHQVLIAAGQKSSQSYAVISAIAKVV